jgi:hypothetical protein
MLGDGTALHTPTNRRRWVPVIGPSAYLAAITLSEVIFQWRATLERPVPIDTAALARTVGGLKPSRMAHSLDRLTFQGLAVWPEGDDATFQLRLMWPELPGRLITRAPGPLVAELATVAS